MLVDVCGRIDRRILLNYRIDPAVLADRLPAPFRPRPIHGYGIGGVCLIRLQNLRPRGVPASLGIGSENAAHRIAVEWDADCATHTGVYVPRRDTDSLLNSALGGRLFPGRFHSATFDTAESDGRFVVTMRSDDGTTYTTVDGTSSDSLAKDSIFDSVEAASAFLEAGSLGYSPALEGDTYDAMNLHIPDWEVRPSAVESLESSFVDNYPDGSVAFDNALLMEDTYHEWREGIPLPETGLT